MRRLVVSIHDVHSSSFEAARRQIAFCESVGVCRFSILVVPNFHMREPFDHCESLVTWLRARENSGDEIVLHGFYHLNTSGSASPANWFWNRIYTTNEAEFVDLDFQTARSRIKDGRQLLLDASLHPVGFIAPAWLMNRDVVDATFNAGFSYTNTIDSVISPSGQTIRSRSLCYSARSEWRRSASLAWNGLLWELKKHADVVRLSLHPRDFEYPALRQQISSILSRIDFQFNPTTYRDLIREGRGPRRLYKFSKTS